MYELVDDDEYGDIVTRRREEDFVIDDGMSLTSFLPSVHVF